MISCKELVDFFIAWEDGTLPGEVKDEFESHLVACPPCLDYLNSYRATIRLGESACKADKAIEPVPERLIQAILAARAKDPGA